METIRRMFRSRFAVIFLLTFVNGLSMTMLFPVLPFIVKSYNQPEVVLWILLGTFSLFQFLASPVMGVLSDMYGRKPVLLITQFGTFLSWIILAGASFFDNTLLLGVISLPILIIFLSRVFDGITGGNASVAQAILADMSLPSERTKVFGMNGAVFGLSLIVWPALGGLSMASSYWYLATAILGWFISLVTLLLMFYFLKESLPIERRKDKVRISFEQINIWSQLKKWGKIETIRYTMIMKTFIFVSFISYTSISTLYLIDKFGFSEIQTGLYLTFTGSFLIFHQTISIGYFICTFRDRRTLLFGTLFMGSAFLIMWLTDSIVVFTLFYFFAVLGISLCLSTLWALLSRSADEANQGEVMGMSASFESFIAILVPILATTLYAVVPLSPYVYIGLFAFLAFIVSKVFFPNIVFPQGQENS